VAHRSSENALAVFLSENLAPVAPVALERVKDLFDVRRNPATIYEKLLPMAALNPSLPVYGLRSPGCFDPFEMAARAVLGQQISVKAAGALAARVAQAFGTPVQTGIGELTLAFPSPQDILALKGSAEENFGPLGVFATRARAILALASAIANGEIDFSPTADPEEETKKLMAIRGVGEWTAQYVAMRALGWADAFLATDAGVKKALGLSPGAARKRAEAWRPYRSYAVFNLWSTLG
jgi:AraC family transcriptional regulator of adaptative response / DNA-3-methyladenine glycosylase II